MYQDIVSEIVSQIFQLTIEVALILWQEILMWIYGTLLLWIQQDMIPLLEESLRLAFISLVTVTVEMLKVVKKAWQEIKHVFLQIIIDYDKSTLSGLWRRRATSLMIKSIQLNKPTILKREVDEEIEWESLPKEVRNAWINKKKDKYKIDVIQTREKELETLFMTQ